MTEAVQVIDSKFRYILIAAKRARQLQGGARPQVNTTSRKPTRIAQEEVRGGAIQWEKLLPEKPAEPAEAPAKKHKK